MADCEIKYCSFIPLVGGFVLGAKSVFKRDPEFHISFENFSFNESFLDNYLPDIPRFYLKDDFENYEEVNKEVHEELSKKNIDLVVAVPPCAGLSMLNSSNTNRGSDAYQNRFMKYITITILKYLKPQVCVFENAPGLFTDIGADLVEDLRKRAKEAGYSFVLYKTNTIKHGLPQYRERTFGFFIKGTKGYILDFIQKDYEKFPEFIKKVKSKEENVKEKSDWFKDSFEYKYLSKYHPDWRDIINNKPGNITDFAGEFIVNMNEYEQMLALAEELDYKGWIKWIKHIKSKHDQNKGWWNGGAVWYKDHTSAVISKNLTVGHPFEDRWLTVEEFSALMGFPEDFGLPQSALGVITQNVPVKTAADMVRQTVKILNNGLSVANTDFVKINNMSQTVEQRANHKLSFKLNKE